MRRPLAVLAAAGTAAHNLYELGNGVGIVWQPELTLPGALALWGVQIPAWVAVASRGSARWDRLVAVVTGASLAGVVVHFTVWPWRFGRLGLPELTEAEGLRPAQLPVYNTILQLWGAAAALSLLRESPGGTRRWGLVGLASLPLLQRSASHHFAWATDQAITNPAWWNRALQPGPSPSAP